MSLHLSEVHRKLKSISFLVPLHAQHRGEVVFMKGLLCCKPTHCSDQYSELQLNTVKLSGSKIKTELQDEKESQTSCNYTHFYLSPLNFNAVYGSLNK